MGEGQCVRVYLPAEMATAIRKEALERSHRRGRLVSMSGLIRESLQDRWGAKGDAAPKEVANG